jgi:hypothetical protein
LADNWFHIDSEKVFNVKKHEIKFVQLLFLHNFFQGIAISVFFTAASAIFLSKVTITDLPLVYIYSSFGILIMGIVYSYLERHLPVKHLLRFVLIFLFLSIVLIRIGLGVIDQIWITFAVFISYKITSMLSSMEFWGMSAILLDIRQSKRLFGIISSGEFTAKLLGYLSIPVLIKFLSFNNLLIISAVAFFICLLILNVIIKNSSIINQITPVNDRDYVHKDDSLIKYLKSKYIFLLSGLSFLAILAFTFIDFSFLVNVKQTFTTKEELGKFIALIYASIKGITFLFKLFLSGRIIDKLGIKKSLLLVPFIFIVVTIGLISYQAIDESHKYIFAFVCSLLIMAEIVRYSVYEPVFYSIFQPLNKNIRLFGHAIVNGYINPIAFAFAGFILYVIAHQGNSINILNVAYCLFVVLIFWMLISLFTNKEYISVLKNAFKRRFFEGSEISFKGKEIQEILLPKLKSNMPEEVIYTAELLVKTDYKDLSNIFKEILQNPSNEVKLYALTKIEDLKLTTLKQDVFDLMNSDLSDQLKETTIRTYCALEDKLLNSIVSYLGNPDINVVKGCITGLLKHGNLDVNVIAGQKLLTLINSSDIKENLIAIDIVGDLNIANFYSPIIEFFDHPNIELKKKAIEAAGKIRNNRFIPYLIDFLNNRYLKDKAFNAVIKFGDDAIDHIEQYIHIHNQTVPDQLIFCFCQICGKIGGVKSHNFLLEYIDYGNVKIRNEVLYMLKLSGYKAINNTEIIKEKLEKEIEQAVWLLHAIQLSSTLIHPNEWLRNAFYIELSNSTENIFNILALVYDSHTVFKAKEGLLTTEQENKANSIEILDNLLPKKYSELLSHLYEDLPIDEKVKKLMFHFPTTLKCNYDDIIGRILDLKDLRFNIWTQVAAVSSVNDRNAKQLSFLLVPYLENHQKIIRESAEVCLVKIHQNKFVDIFNILAPYIDNKKLEEIMERHTTLKSNTLLEIEKVIILKSTSLFTETPENILVDIASIVREERVAASDTVFEKGDQGSSMYIISEGEVRIHDGDVTFAVLNNRDFFGELALLDPEPRSASVTALKDSLLLRLDQEDFYELMSERTEVAKGILKVLCRRLRDQNSIIGKLKAQVPSEN